MPKFTLGVTAQLDDTPKGTDVFLELGFRRGMGPTTFFLETYKPADDPNAVLAFSIDDLIRDIADLIKYDVLEKVADIGAHEPWSKIFKVNIQPEITATPTGAKASVQAVLKLSEPGAAPGSGITLGGQLVPGITMEPKITVYELLVGYMRGEGMDLRALVKFWPQKTGNGPTSAGAGKKKSSKTEIVSYPFPVPSSGQGELFEIKYLGLGQRFGPEVDMQVEDPLATAFDKLEKFFTDNDPQSLLENHIEQYYHPDRDWFIAAHVLLKGWEVRVLFNDPVLYGLEVSCSRPASPFNGLVFEILYEKLGPHLGVYYGELSLPQKFRQIQLGEVSLSLPSFAIWIYTNGDFQVAVGWPPGKEPIGIQFEVFLGGGGFYFGKMRSGDQPHQDKGKDVVNYNPILEFGLAAYFGIGRSFQEGVVSAQATLTVHASFQGLLAWQLPKGEHAGIDRPPDYFWFTAAASIVGILSGSVDLGIISATLNLTLSVGANIAVETDKKTGITIWAHVNISLSIHIAFITIHIGFHATISHTFVIGVGNGYAKPDGPSVKALKNMDQFPGEKSLQAPRPDVLDQPLFDEPRPEPVYVNREVGDADLPDVSRPAPRSVGAGQEKTTVHVHFLLNPTTVYDASAQGTNCAVASLVVPAPASPNASAATTTDFEVLLTEMAGWLLAHYGGSSPSWQAVRLALGHGWQRPAGFQHDLAAHLADTFDFRIEAVDLTASNAALQGAIFPMFPQLQMSCSGAQSPVHFGLSSPTPSNYDAIVEAFFAELDLMVPPKEGTKVLLERLGLGSEPVWKSMTGVIFVEYFLTLSRYLAQKMVDASDGAGRPSPAAAPPMPDATVAASVAGMVSRFMLHGMRLPDPAQISTPNAPWAWKDDEFGGVFGLTGQQVDMQMNKGTFSATLSVDPGVETDPLGQAITFGSAASTLAAEAKTPTSVTSHLPAAAPPPAPQPNWQVEQAAGGANASSSDGQFTVTPIAPVSSHPHWFAARNRIPWTRDGQPYQFVVPLPEPVQKELSAAPYDLVLTDKPVSSSDTALETINFARAIQIRLRAHKVHRERSGDVATTSAQIQFDDDGKAKAVSPYVPNLYQLDGADDETRTLLEKALSRGDLGMATLEILHTTSASSGYESVSITGKDKGGQAIFLKTNLSTATHPNSVAVPLHLLARRRPTEESAAPLGPTHATIDQVPDALELVWENSVAHASGFYLYYAQADGKGLPESAFRGESADLTLLVTLAPANTDPAPAIENCLLVDKNVAGSIYLGLRDAQGNYLAQYQPTFPPGCVGVEVCWTPVSHMLGAQNDAPFSPSFTDRLYHMMQVRLGGDAPADAASDSNYWASLWSRAIGPKQPTNPDTGQVTEGSLLYHQVVPAYRFIKESGVNPGENSHIYAPVGDDAHLSLRLLDLFGNPLPVNGLEHDFAVGYNDALIPPAQWPGVHAGYQIAKDKSGAPSMAVSLHFLPQLVLGKDAAATASGKRKAKAQEAVKRFGVVVAQLNDSNTSAKVTSTLVAGDGAVDPDGGGSSKTILSSLRTFVGAVLEQLEAVVKDPSTKASEVRGSLALQMDRSQVCKLDDIFEVRQTLWLTRPKGLVSPLALDHMAEAYQVSSSIPPDLQPASTSDTASSSDADRVAMRQFARDFEAAFAAYDGADGELKLALRADTDGAHAAMQPDYLWGVRLSKTQGIAFDCDTSQPAAFFSLAPLSTKLMDISDIVPPLDDDGQPVQLPARLDIDALAAAFLKAFDAFLAPSMATAVAALKPKIYQNLLQRKAVLADAISQGLKPVFVPDDASTPPPGDIAQARERFQQALLRSLSSAYGTTALVQRPFDVRVEGTLERAHKIAPRIYGPVCDAKTSSTGADDTSHPYSLTSARLSLQPTESAPNWLTFLATTAHPGTSVVLPLEPRFQPGFLEHDIRPDDEDYGYTPSSWLKFVLTDADPRFDVALGEVDVPVPLRRFPDLPRCKRQKGVAAPGGIHNGDPIAKIIASAMTWDYDVTVDKVDRDAEDELWMTITYNAPVDPEGQKGAGVTALAQSDSPSSRLVALLQTLVNFSVTYAKIESQLDSITGKLWPGEAGSKPTPDELIETMNFLIAEVADAWLALFDPSADLGTDSETTEQQSYMIDFVDAYDGQQILKVYAQKGAPWPTINGQRYSQAPTPVPPPSQAPVGGDWEVATYPYDEAKHDEALEMVWSDLNALTYQTATSDYWIVRDANLEAPAGYRVNPAFIYCTQPTAFPSPTLPHIQVTDPIEVPAADTLADALENVFKPFLQAVTPGAHTQPCELKAEFRYSYALGCDANGDDLFSSSAVVLADRLHLTPSPSQAAAPQADTGTSLDAFAQGVADELTAWYHQQKMSTHRAFVGITITLIATTKSTQLPLASLTDVRIPVPDGWWPKTSSSLR